MKLLVLNWAKKFFSYSYRYETHAIPLNHLFLDPKFITRELSWIFSLITLACLVSINHDKDGLSIYGQSDNIHNFGVTVSLFGFFLSMVLFCLDLYYPYMHSINHKKLVGKMDIITSGAMCFLYCVSFLCLLIAWNLRKPISPETINYGQSNARASITLSFLSIFTWFISLLCAIYIYKRRFVIDDNVNVNMFVNNMSRYTSFPTTSELVSPSNFPPQKVKSPFISSPEYVQTGKKTSNSVKLNERYQPPSY